MIWGDFICNSFISLSFSTGQELPYEHKRLQDFYKPLPAESEGDITPHRLGDNEQFTIHTADHVVIKSRSKTCTIL